jgi:hypothetical protein
VVISGENFPIRLGSLLIFVTNNLVGIFFRMREPISKDISLLAMMIVVSNNNISTTKIMSSLMLYIKLKHKNKTDIEISVTTQNVVVDILFEFFFLKKKKKKLT